MPVDSNREAAGGQAGGGITPTGGAGGSFGPFQTLVNMAQEAFANIVGQAAPVGGQISSALASGFQTGGQAGQAGGGITPTGGAGGSFGPFQTLVNMASEAFTKITTDAGTMAQGLGTTIGQAMQQAQQTFEQATQAMTQALQQVGQSAQQVGQQIQQSISQAMQQAQQTFQQATQQMTQALPAGRTKRRTSRTADPAVHNSDNAAVTANIPTSHSTDVTVDEPGWTKCANGRPANPAVINPRDTASEHRPFSKPLSR